MTAVLTLTRWTLLEALRRRLVLTGAILGAAFVALYTVGFVALDRQFGGTAEPGAGVFAVGARTSQVVLGLYIVQFLASFLAVLLAAGAVSREVDSGALHAVLARPVGRAHFLAGRALALAGLVTGYVVVMAGAVLLVARVVGGYDPVDPVRTVALMVLQVLVLVAAGLCASTVLPTVTAGVVLFSLYGLAWLAGIIELLGDAVGNQTMVDLGIVVSLLFPTDAVWRGASYYAQPPLVLAGAVGGTPFVSQAPPTAALIAWVTAYVVLALAVAMLAFRRRDL